MSCDTVGHHVAILMFQDKQVSGYGVRDLRTDFAPLTKEFLHRVAGIHPDLARQPCSLRARKGTLPTGRPCLSLEATVAGEAAPVATRDVPLEKFAGVARAMADSIGLAGQFTFGVFPLKGDDPLVVDWDRRRKAEETDFVLDEAEVELRLPDDFSVGQPPGQSRVLHDAGTWLRCLFRRTCYDEYLQAAAAERSVERAWIATGHTYLEPDACTVVIERLVETSGESTWCSLTTDGVEVDRLRRRFGGRRQGYLHLHPPYIVDDKGQKQKVAPAPSGADLALAINFDRVPRPTVYPLCLFGVDPERPDGDLAVYGFQDGVLTPITTLLETE